MALSVNESGKAIILEHSVNGIVRLLLDTNSSARANARSTILQASENRLARFAFAREMLMSWVGSPEDSVELIERVFGPRAAEPLCELQGAAEKNFRMRATKCLAALASKPGDAGNNQVCSTLYIVEKTAKVLAESVEDNCEWSEESAITLLRQLTSAHKYAERRLKEFLESDPRCKRLCDGRLDLVRFIKIQRNQKHYL